MLYGFGQREIARRLKQQALSLPGQQADEGIPLTDFYLFQTPSGGIPAIDGTTLGKADCTLYKLSFDGSDATIGPWNDNAGLALTRTVYNMGSAAVEENVYIQVARINGLYVANWEDCDAAP